ncbi:transposase [Saccharopolyspora gloriosae]|uniref:transposase n=1 Tax=Saccharopolyspora gloriosae TaxID=455344 RepID=UPI001FB77858|nr:transposase [Saccharopolyspora gloriosae]
MSSYSPEFREEAVRLAVTSGKPISQVARELDMNQETLRTWVRRDQAEKEPTEADLPVDERAELKELRRRNRELEQENSFLKKAAAYFAKDPR